MARKGMRRVAKAARSEAIALAAALAFEEVQPPEFVVLLNISKETRLTCGLWLPLSLIGFGLMSVTDPESIFSAPLP